MNKLLLAFFLSTLLFTRQGIGADYKWLEASSGVVTSAYRAGAMLILNDRISSVSQTYGTLRFSAGHWQSYTGNQGLFSTVQGCMFVDSNGNMYVSARQNNSPYTSYIMESLVSSGADYGLIWTQGAKFVDSTPTNMIWSFTEDEYGNIWAGEYVELATGGAHLWRKKPGGSWTIVTEFTGARHVHYVYYDKWRRALYVAVGEESYPQSGIRRLDYSKLNQNVLTSSDYTTLLQYDPDNNKILPTAMVADANFLYVGMDWHLPDSSSHPPNQGRNRGIARIVDLTSTGGQSIIEYVYPLSNCGLATWADVDNYGNIIFRYTGASDSGCSAGRFFNKIIFSQDHGSTWNVAADYGSAQENSGPMQYTGLASSFGNPNWSGIYAGGNGYGGSSGPAAMGRLIPNSTTTYYMDQSSGVDWLRFGIDPSKPIQSLRWLQSIPYNAQGKLQISPAAGPVKNCRTVRQSMDTYTTFTPSKSENFESANTANWNFTLSQSGNSTVSRDTTIYHSGAASMKLVRDTTGPAYASLKDVGALAAGSGDTIYANYWIYYPNDQSADSILLRIIDNGTSPYESRITRVAAGSTRINNELVLGTSADSFASQAPSRRPLTTGQWHNIQYEQYLHPASGYIQIHVDGELWFMSPGIQTLSASNNNPQVNSLYFYISPGCTLYVDDFTFGVVHGAVTPSYDYCFSLNAAGPLTIRSNNISIDHIPVDCQGSGTGVTVQSGVTGASLTNVTVGRCTTGYDIRSNSTITNSTGSGVAIAGGVTVTGDYNIFSDSHSAGSGTYADGGQTRWSTDPLFVNAANGNFHLIAGSPAIDAGAWLGALYDFDGNPIIGRPDIGAFEYQGQIQQTDFVTVKITTSNMGSGTVTSAPLGITCGSGGGICSAPFVANSPVTLAASPNPGSNFAGWSGGGCMGTTPCTVTLTSAVTVTALFTMNPPVAPQTVAPTNVTDSGFTAGWSSVIGASGYRLDVSTDSQFLNFVTGYNDLDVGNVTSCIVTGLSLGTTYYYRVRAYNAVGVSGNSNIISVSTSSQVSVPAVSPLGFLAMTGGLLLLEMKKRRKHQ